MTITNPQEIIDFFYQEDAKEKLKKKPRSTDHWKTKIYTNFNYSTGGDDDRPETKTA